MNKWIYLRKDEMQSESWNRIIEKLQLDSDDNTIQMRPSEAFSYTDIMCPECESTNLSEDLTRCFDCNPSEVMQ